jgi:hypothetical protein
MKAITLWQPWAGLVANGWKECETRGWYTAYRGPLAIHAAARPADPADISYFTFALAKYGQQMPELLYGVVVATCEMVACLPSALVECKAKQLHASFTPRHGWEVEKIFGNYEAGRWAWIFHNVQPLEKPATARGARKLWDWSPK